MFWTSPPYHEKAYYDKVWPVVIVFEHRWFFRALISATSLEIAQTPIQIPSPQYLVFSYKLEKRGLMSSIHAFLVILFVSYIAKLMLVRSIPSGNASLRNSVSIASFIRFLVAKET